MAPKYQGHSRICISISKIPGIQYSVLAAAKNIVFFLHLSCLEKALSFGRDTGLRHMP